ncbi:MAG: pitrilysin family protein [Saprospiraceae bacterium]
MKQLLLMALLASFFLSAPAAYAQDVPKYNPDDINIPYKKYTLPNGLRLLVHEDHKAPIVAVNVWYHVGAKNERLGKSGFAHLFEHLMFNGSENFNTDYFQALEAIGSTDLNGTTNEDRTNYFQNIPVGALDQVLWLESDRMGHLLGAIDQAKLDEQRGVVQNEKRQGENQPYSRGWDIAQKEMYAPHHPYGHTVIGEMEDLNAASLTDVHEWFKAYYGAANAVLVIAGDITAEAAYEKVIKYFGNIPAGPTISRPGLNIPVRTYDTRASYQDRVPEEQIRMVWHMPQWGTQETVWLDLATDVLAAGKTSRLFKKLVYEKQLCSSAVAFVNPNEISGELIVQANVKKGKSLEEVEKLINEILEEFIAKGPTEEETSRVKAAYFANYIKGLERIGGFGGKSDVLAEHEVYGGSADYYKKKLRWYDQTTAKDIHNAVKKWMTRGRFTLTCHPYPEYSVTGTEADRSKAPVVDTKVSAQFPDIQRATLKNGMKVVLTRRTESPTVVMNMLINAGFCTDKMPGGKLGLASLSMNMLDEGSKSLTSLQISERLQMLGASLSTTSDLDYGYVGLNALRQSLDPSLDLMADVVLNPAFPEADFTRLKNQQISGIQNEKKQPTGMVIRVLPELLYGKDHPYGMPMSGTGNEESVAAFTLDDVRGFYNRWVKPNNATIVVTGDITMPELVEKLEKRFGTWAKGDVPKKVIPEVTSANRNKIFLIDRPESQQSFILATHLTKPYGQLDETAIEQMNNVLGGDFTSRINMNLREDKHWSYGARSGIMNTAGQRPFFVMAPVQTDKTSESIKEAIKEINQYVGEKPMTQAEFDKTKQNTVMAMSGMWETNGAVNGSTLEVVKYGLKDDYWKTYSQRVQNLTLKDVQGVAKTVVQPGEISWVMAADAEKVAPGLEKLGMEVIQLDASGKVVSKKAKP